MSFSYAVFISRNKKDRRVSSTDIAKRTWSVVGVTSM